MIEYSRACQVDFEETSYKIYFGFVGGKGDWVWLRKAYTLMPGWTSKRVCYLCDQQAEHGSQTYQ